MASDSARLDRFFLLLLGWLVFSLAASEASATAAINLTADVNRDTVIDPATDEEGEDAWTPDRGAIFLNNCDSDFDTGRPDHADDVVNGPRDLDDLARIRVARIPGLDPHAGVMVDVDRASRGHVRLFIAESGDSWRSLELGKPSEGLALALGRADQTLLLEANSFAGPGWSGETDVAVGISPPGQPTTTDTVRLRVAPFLLPSHLDRGNTVYIREYKGQNNILIGQLRALVRIAGADLHIVREGDGLPYRQGRVWLQDSLEIGHTEMPGSRMPVALRANRDVSLDEFSRLELLGPDFGWFTCGTHRESLGEEEAGMDWFGNIEVTPPLPGHPNGLVYHGVDGGATMDPAILGMLEAQGLQGPAVAIDVGWLQVGHVDEALCFIPSRHRARPFRVLVPDAALGARLFEEWNAAGHGGLEILAPYADPALPTYIQELSRYEVVNVAAIAGDAALLEHNRRIQAERIDPMIDHAQAAFGLAKEDLVRVPYLQFESGRALIPNMVNSLVLNGHVIMPDPQGPRVRGQDLLREYMQRRLIGVAEPHFVDDRRYHSWSGNVHCATKVHREPPATSWWIMRE